MAPVFGFGTNNNVSHVSGTAPQSPSRAKAGALGAASAKDAGRHNEDTPHYHFIHSMLLPSTVRIQKELRGRRFKVRGTLLVGMGGDI